MFSQSVSSSRPSQFIVSVPPHRYVMVQWPRHCISSHVEGGRNGGEGERCGCAVLLVLDGFAELFVAAAIDHLAIAQLLQKVLRGGRTATGAAVEHHRLILVWRDGRDAGSQLFRADTDRAGNRAFGIFLRGSYVDQQGVGALQRLQCPGLVYLPRDCRCAEGEQDHEQAIHRILLCVTDQPKRWVRLGRIRMTAVATRISVACLNFFCLNMLAPFYCCWCHVLLDHLSHPGVLRFVGKAGNSGALCAWVGKALLLLLDKQIADQQLGVLATAARDMGSRAPFTRRGHGGEPGEPRCTAQRTSLDATRRRRSTRLARAPKKEHRRRLVRDSGWKRNNAG